MIKLSDSCKLDSTGNGGFRRQNVRHLLSCKNFRIDKSFLLEKLGKPNQIRETYGGVQYLYYYYDFRTLPKGEDGPMACAYIAFFFREGESWTSWATEGDIDL